MTKILNLTMISIAVGAVFTALNSLSLLSLVVK